ncbi:Uncharacterised protein [Legionella lansingensis]|uniref:Substrate of the Dot/Icm secretion system n=1 Tax=Legionella lansingensis TaxID=45067 RepID=A0A0W0VUQ9_9GAMM|nr:hypothetical protein [Legionella lansingensis]KTD23868.1 hypothetical protein Llan_0649 [Legionella lansingensis]SNV46578.1 Uncharacterised protein [Legionella lansingensis]
MSTKKEDAKKDVKEDLEKQQKEKEEALQQFVLLQENRKRNAQEEEAYQKLLAQYGDEIIKNPDLLKTVKKEEKEVSYVVQTIHIDLMQREYEKQFESEGRKVEKTEEGIVFKFKSKEEAVSFFQDQAKKGRAFEVYNANKDVDHCMYSDGKGNFVQGTKAQIAEYKADPEKFKEKFDIGEDGALKEKEPKQEFTTAKV